MIVNRKNNSNNKNKNNINNNSNKNNKNNNDDDSNKIEIEIKITSMVRHSVIRKSSLSNDDLKSSDFLSLDLDIETNALHQHLKPHHILAPLHNSIVMAYGTLSNVDCLHEPPFLNF